MAKGVKTGGRAKGTPNKRTQEVIDEAKAGGLMPLDYMLSVLRNDKLDSTRRDWAAEKAAPYLHAKLTSNEHTGADGAALVIKWKDDDARPEGSSGTRQANGKDHNGSGNGVHPVDRSN